MTTLGHLHLPELIDLIRFQKLHNFLECKDKYNEDLVRIFFAGVQGNFEDFEFRYRMNNKNYMISSHVWKYLVQMCPVDSDSIKISDSNVAPGYEFKTALNFMLKKPYTERIVNNDLFPKSVTTGALAPIDRILFWIVCRIIRPKKGGYSCVEKP